MRRSCAPVAGGQRARRRGSPSSRAARSVFPAFGRQGEACDARVREAAIVLFVLLGSVALFGAGTGAAATLPAGFAETQVATGLAAPTAMAFAPDGRIFVAEQGGRLRVIKNGTLLAAPFVTVTVNSAGERGLLGVAFDPDFATNEYVYVYYTTASRRSTTASAASPPTATSPCRAARS